MKRSFLMCMAALSCPAVASVADLSVIGALAPIKVEQAGQSYMARIDTGARVTSLHAYNLHIDDDDTSHPQERHIGKEITFSTANELGNEASYTTEVIDVISVRNAHGVESRYVVELDLAYKGDSQKIRVTLRDRGHLSYKLLIGRNWLRGTYIVDVAQ